MTEKTIRYISWSDDYILHLEDLKNIKVYYDTDSYYFYAKFEPFYYSYGFDLYQVDRIFGIGTVGKEYRFNGEYETRKNHFKNLKVGDDIVKYVEKEIGKIRRGE